MFNVKLIYRGSQQRQTTRAKLETDENVLITNMNELHKLRDLCAN